jgi:hypothetical protein
VRDRPPRLLSWILAGQSHYPDYLLRAEGRRRAGAGLVGEYLFHHLRDENAFSTSVAIVYVLAHFLLRFLFRFLLGGY